MASTKGINIISVPSDVGSVYAGKSRAPAAFEAAGLYVKLQAAGLQIDLSPALPSGGAGWTSAGREPNGARNESATVAACQDVQNAVLAVLANSNTDKSTPSFQLILSGECLYCPAILSAYWRHLSGTKKRIGIIYVDADCDLSTPAEPNGTGNIAGMTLTHMTLREGALESMKQFSRSDGGPVVDGTNIVLFGLNIESSSNQRAHLGYLFDEAFRITTSRAVQKAPVETARKALEWMEEQVDFILVHLDVDVIDPGQFPLGNVPNWTGLGFEETMVAMKTFLKSEKVVGLSVAEVNPDHDPGLQMTTQLVDKLVEALSEKSWN